MRNFDLNGEQFDVVSKLKSFGIQLRCAEGMSNDIAEDRVSEGIAVSRRIRRAPLPLQTTASLIACLVGSAAMYGFRAGGYTLRLQWLQLYGARNAEADAGNFLLTLFAKRHFVDPFHTKSEAAETHGRAETRGLR